MIIKFNEKLESTGFMENLDFSKPFKVMIDAPTGSGKTYYVVNYLKENNIPFVFLTDTLLLMKQISETYGVNSYEASDRQHYDSEQLITVYNHIEKFWKDKVVVVDEAHSLITDYGFKRDVIDNVLTFIGEAKQVILLSGTSLQSKDEVYKLFNFVKFEYNEPTTKTLKIHNISKDESKLEYAVRLAIEAKNKGNVPVISLLNTNTAMQELRDLLAVNGFNNIGLINSITKEENELDLDCSFYKELVENSTISADCIITTYVQGYNINNTNCSLIIIPTNNKHSYISIVQMMARFRNIANMETVLIVRESTPNVDDNGNEIIPKPWYNFTKMYNVIEESLVTNVLNTISETKKEYTTSRAIKHFLKLNAEHQQYIDNNLEINYQMISLNVVTTISNLLYVHLQTANTVLNQFNINVELETTLNTEIMEANELQKLNYRIIVDTFFNYLEVGKFYNTNMGHKVKEYYDELKELRLLDSEIKPILQQTFGDKKAFKKVVLSLQFRQSEDGNIKRMRKDIFSSIKVGQWYSSQNIFDIVAPIVNENGGECNSKSKASEILNFLFETTEQVVKIDSKAVRGLNIKLRK